ncbi:MAG TPA: superoxide dismutase [Flavobacteriales bacterium]|nr:superoxide dismutase [Flavobacteriales bacterium]
MDRKQFITRSLQAVAGAAVVGPTLLQAESCANTQHSVVPPIQDPPIAADPLTFAQVPLPYSYEALEPSIDKLTMEIHYTKHHAAYVKNVNDAIVAEGVTATSAEDLFKKASSVSPKVRNNAGGAWNHNFFWQVMRPATENTPSGKVADAINGGFGSLEKFKELFTDAAMKRFGSGWAWLVMKDGKLAISSTPNQDNPLMDVSDLKGTPLLALDVWEHAYYLKYQNKRAEYITNWWSLVNWDEVAKRMG